jgi:hypothetical protein
MKFVSFTRMDLVKMPEPLNRLLKSRDSYQGIASQAAGKIFPAPAIPLGG